MRLATCDGQAVAGCRLPTTIFSSGAAVVAVVAAVAVGSEPSGPGTLVEGDQAELEPSEVLAESAGSMLAVTPTFVRNGAGVRGMSTASWSAGCLGRNGGRGA